MIVADTNLIAYLLRSDLQGLARRALQMDKTWAAPVLWRSKFSSVLGR